jgi:primary-amine oxidase
MAQAVERIAHPLQILSTDEIGEAVAILRAGAPGGWDDRRYRFVEVSLKEPAKSALAAAEESGRTEELPREARVVLIDRGDRATIEAFVSLSEGKLISWDVVAVGQAPFIMEEILACEETIRKDPDFQAAMAKRGITDMDLVWVDPWPFGFYDDEPEYAKHRLTRGLVWVRANPDDDNGYAHPVENVILTFDLNDGKILRLQDFGVVHVPMEEGNYGPEDVGPLRTDLKPLEITQPQGPSFEVDGYDVTWQNWQFRVGFTPREGLVLHQVKWVEDDGRERPIMYRAGMGDMVVPYGDPNPTHVRKNTYDGGELNFGALINSLTLGCDCLGEIYYFDVALADADGKPFTLKNAICMHEEDYGVLWRHTNWRSGRTDMRRSRRLVVSVFATIGNYDYGIFWYFYQDGTIQCEVKLTGIVSTGAVEPGTQPTHGTLLNADGLYAPLHQHFFSFRLDMDVDGTVNNVYEEHGETETDSSLFPLQSSFRTVRTQLKSELEAQQLIDPLRGRVWKIVNPSSLNAAGDPVAYRLLPMHNVEAMASPASNIARRAGFMMKHFWATPYQDDEKTPAGDFPAQHPGTGLPEWTAADRSLEDTDVVVWYTLGSHHSPRPEDWPVMPVGYASFMLQPHGFFNQNPALNQPIPEAHGNGSHCCSHGAAAD